MPYVIKYKTIVSESPCSVTLRGIFEDGRYFGDVVVWDHKFAFNFDGYIKKTNIESIFKSITYLKNAEPIKTDAPIDCCIGEFPMQSQVVLFYHYVDHEYESETKHYFDILINSLKNEFDILIQNKVNEYKKT